MTDQTPTAQPSLLIVDDEANILSSLQRLFRPLGYRIQTALGGDAALALMETEPADLVISDMRMPGMSGAQFLEAIDQRWPSTVRILMTGYADMTSTIDAINRGEIYRYVAKPWNDQEMIQAVRQGLEKQHLEREHQRLLVLTREQNDALQSLNAGLETKVQERTASLEKAMGSLRATFEQLQKNHLATIQAFANLLGMRSPGLAEHAKRVAELVRQIGRRMEIEGKDMQDLVVAAILHDIGKLAFPDNLLGMPVEEMSSDQRSVYMRYPIRSAQSLAGVDSMTNSAAIIRAHHEHFDGRGFPDGLTALMIPIGARILAVANDYDSMQAGMHSGKKLPRPTAIKRIVEGRNHRYDPSVIDAFLQVVGKDEVDIVVESELTTASLRPGMVLSKDILTGEEVLLLAKGTVLIKPLIDQLIAFERAEKVKLVVNVIEDVLHGQKP